MLQSPALGIFRHLAWLDPIQSNLGPDLQGKLQQVHDLGDEGAGNTMDTGQFSLVADLVGSEELLKSLCEKEWLNCRTLIHNSGFDTMLLTPCFIV